MTDLRGGVRDQKRARQMVGECDRLEILRSFRHDEPDLARAVELAAGATVITDLYNESQRPIVSYWFGAENHPTG
ncbi:MAG: hypothetical protein ABI939_10585, partial [Anaerolineaceae bacterium]